MLLLWNNVITTVNSIRKRWHWVQQSFMLFLCTVPLWALLIPSLLFERLSARSVWFRELAAVSVPPPAVQASISSRRVRLILAACRLLPDYRLPEWNSRLLELQLAWTRVELESGDAQWTGEIAESSEIPVRMTWSCPNDLTCKGSSKQTIEYFVIRVNPLMECVTVIPGVKLDVESIFERKDTTGKYNATAHQPVNNKRLIVPIIAVQAYLNF